MIRHKSQTRCPICDGADGDPRGVGRRCSGWTSDDGAYVHCSRDEHAGDLDQESGGTYAHRMHGSCRCGVQHGESKSGTYLNTFEATYDYRDAQGALLFQVVRKPGKQFRQRKPDGAGGWLWKLGDTPRVLYRLPELLAADPALPVYVVEGEKDVENLVRLGNVATCNPMGAGKWPPVSGCARAALKGRTVVVIADADKVGRDHANVVAGSLRGVAGDVRVVECPAPHKDVSDLLDAGGSLEDLVAPGQSVALPVASPAEPTNDTVPVDPDAGDDDVLTDDEIRDGQSQLTDAANADAVVAAYPNTFLFVVEWEAWIAWDSRRWALPGGKSGAKDRVLQAIKRTARVRYLASKERLRGLEEQEKEILTQIGKGSEEHEANVLAQKHEGALLRWLANSQNTSRLTACETQLRGMLVVRAAELDAQPWLFNVKNGTVDLRTGELHFHERTDLLTQCSMVDYERDAICPTWNAFLHRAMRGNDSMVQFLQRLVGYTLTGTTQEHILVFHHGNTGSNGKSTFLATLGALLGEYGCTAPRTLLFEPKNGADPHPAELARLYGKRLATCSEVPENAELAEAKVKDLTGGDIISVRRMSENFWDMTPMHTLHAAGNHKPTVRGTDGGIWRRIKLIPWLDTIAEAEKDKDLKAKLKSELSGILAWGIRGCLDWRANGLGEPADVTSAGHEYRSESDVLGAFLATHCVFEAEARFACTYLRKAYETWCEEMGHRSVGARLLGRRLREGGASNCTVRAGGKAVEGWKGVRLKSALELSVEATELEDPHQQAN